MFCTLFLFSRITLRYCGIFTILKLARLLYFHRLMIHMDSMSKQSRIQFFDDALWRLQKASQQGFYSLQCQAFLELTGFQQSYPNIPLQINLHFSYNQIHAYSQSIWPRDASKDLILLKRKGNGNCFYRSVSLLCSGSEDYHLEFRARTVCELVLNSSFYLVEDKCSILSFEGATPIKMS